MAGKQIPISSFFDYAPQDIPRFCPDGNTFTFIAPDGDHPPTIWGANSPSDQATRLLPDHDAPILQYRWAYTGRHLLYLQDHDGDENWQLHVHDLTTGTTHNLISRASVRVQSYHVSPKEPNTVIIIMNMRDRSLYEAYSYNLQTDTLAIMARNDGTIKSWYVDSNLKIRGKVAYNGSGSFYLYIRANHRSPWQHTHTWLPDDTFTSGPLFFSNDNRYLYITDASATNTNRLLAIDTLNGEKTTLVHDDQYDMSSTSLHDVITLRAPYPSKVFNNDGTLAGFSYYKEKLVWHFLPGQQDHPLYKILTDTEWQQWIADSTNPHNIIIGRCTDTQPISFWHYHIPSGRFEQLFCTKPSLAALPSSQPVESVQFTARDGMPINAYLWRPQGVANPPFVIKIHGGPWAREIGSFESCVQFLTSRGYGCLQVNFRGSTGYGKQLTNAGNKEWGGRMVDDIADAAEWLCKNGHTIAKRIALMGRSYGGYSALCASWRYQELFTCAIAEVAPTHLPDIMNSLPLHWRPFLSNFHHRLGHPVKDKLMLRKFSPALNTDKMSIPLLISHGKNDARVPYAQSTTLLNKLEQSEVTTTTLSFDDEGHRSRRAHNIITYHEAVEAFLAEHLPVEADQ